jgi:hypothetical protein
VGNPHLRAALCAPLLALAACGSAGSVPSPPDFARTQLGEAGWRVTSVLPARTTRICDGGRRRHVDLVASADDEHLSGGVALAHPHLTAFLFPKERQAVACLDAYVRSAGGRPRPGPGLEQVVHTAGQVHVVEQVNGYFVITSSNGPLWQLRRAAERAFTQLSVAFL